VVRIVAVVGVLDLLVYGLVLLAQTIVGDEPIDWVQPLGPALGGFLGTLIGLSLLAWSRQRRAGEPERRHLRSIRTAARTGRLPAGVDPAVWAPLLARERHLHRRRMFVVAALHALLAIVLLALLVRLTGGGLGGFLLRAAVSVQLMTLVWSAGKRHQRRIAGLLARLPSSAGAEAPPG